MPDVSHETTIHSNVLAAHIKETDRARTYRALSALVGSGLDLREAAGFMLQAHRHKARPGGNEMSAKGALEGLHQGKSVVEAFAGVTLPIEELAMVMRIDAMTEDNGDGQQVAKLLGVAADMLQFDLTMRGAGRNS